MARRSPTSNRPVRPSSPAARREGIPRSPLAQKMLQHMQLAGLAISNRRVVKCEPGPDGLGRVTFTYRPSGSRCYRAMTVTLNQVYELIVAAKPLPVPHRPSCPACGGTLTCVGFLPAFERILAALNSS